MYCIRCITSIHWYLVPLQVSDVLVSFGKKSILTRGFHSINDPDWEHNWKEILSNRPSAHSSSVLSSYAENRLVSFLVHTYDFSFVLDEGITLGAYAVNIQHSTDRKEGAILQILLQRYDTRRAIKRIWELPAVSVVIEYHWRHWARSFLVGSFGFFMAWLLSYVSFLVVYIVL